MLEALKTHKSSEGVPVGQFLKRKHPSGEWVEQGDELIYQTSISGMLVQYKWKVVDGEIEVVSGRASELTPDLDTVAELIRERREKVSTTNLQIYDEVLKHFGEHGDMDEAFREIANLHGLDKENVEAIYLSVDKDIHQRT